MSDRIWLVLAQPYDPGTSGTVDVRWSLGSRAPKYNGQHWAARLVSPPTLSARAWSDDDPFRDGGGAIEVSSITVNIMEDGDDLKSYHWPGQTITIYRGEPGDTFEDFVTVVTTTVADVEWTASEFVILLAPPLVRLGKPLQQNFYAGTGGSEGDANVRDQPKPYLLGKARGVEPVEVSTIFRLYQANDGDVGGFDAVYSGGRPLEIARLSVTDPEEFILERQTIEIADFGGAYDRSATSYYALSPDAQTLIGVISTGTTDTPDFSQHVFPGPFTFRSPGFRGSAIGPGGLYSDGPLGDPTIFRGVAVSDDGNYFYVVNATGYATQYGFSAPFNALNDVTYTSGDFVDLRSLIPEWNTTSLYSPLAVSNDGATAYIGCVGRSGADRFYYIAQLDLSTAYDITTASFTTGNIVEIGSRVSAVETGAQYAQSLGVSDNGQYIYYIDTDDRLGRIYMPDAWDLSSVGSGDSTISTTGVVIPEYPENVNFSLTAGCRLRENAAGEVVSLVIVFRADAAAVPESYVLVSEFRFAAPNTDPANLTDRLRRDECGITTEGGLIVNDVPAGVVTVDVTSSGGHIPSGSVPIETAGELIDFILSRELAAGEIDSAGLAQLDTDTGNAPVSYYTGPERVSIIDAARAVAASVGAVITTNAAGQVTARQIKFRTPVATVRDRQIVRQSFQRTTAGRPAWKVNVGYLPTWRLHTDAEIDTQSPENAVVNYLRREFREESSESSAIRDAHANAQQRVYPGLYAVESDASAEALRRLNLLGALRDVYTIEVFDVGFTITPGDTVTLVSDDARDSAGLDMIVKSVIETQAGTVPVTVLELWG